MGWVGVAIVVATTCFLLYRHPPASWFPEPPVAESTPEEKEGKADNEEPSPIIERTSQPAAAKGEPVEEAQTTPKASISTAPTPVLDVPFLQLDDGETDNVRAQKAQQDTTQQPTNSSPILSPSSTTPAQSNPMAPPSSTPKQPQPPAANDSSLMPPPPPPSHLQPPSLQNQRRPQPQSRLAPPAGRFPPPRPNSGAGTLAPPPSAASSLRVPPGMRPGASTTSNSLSPNKVTLTPAKQPSQRAVLEPGFSPLDWAALTSNPNHKLRGASLPPTLLKVTPSMLKVQNGRKGMDAWTSYQGKVYNISPYLPFHPGGKGELLRGAGKDSGKLFLEIHPWVNWDAILGECMVGILVSEHEAVEENKLDAMD
ncbi:hypothetical protein BDW74DRAFT_142049 [Aspergillus multicolor]|uniref:uncharacterized protein n=1 Tax=Aspergillus multicolor TaxID=41759 RepID=UPI003CCE3C8E